MSLNAPATSESSAGPSAETRAPKSPPASRAVEVRSSAQRPRDRTRQEPRAADRHHRGRDRHGDQHAVGLHVEHRDAAEQDGGDRERAHDEGEADQPRVEGSEPPERDRRDQARDEDAGGGGEREAVHGRKR
jgi:hypothetical protein